MKLNKAKKYKLEQEKLRSAALKKGVNLIAPETIFLSKDTQFGKNSIQRNCNPFGSPVSPVPRMKVQG